MPTVQRLKRLKTLTMVRIEAPRTGSMQGTITLENWLVVFYKVKYVLNIEHSNSTPNYYSQNENMSKKIQ